MKNSNSILILVHFLCFSLIPNLSVGGDTISVNESVSLGQTIISSGGNFELGFFRPGDSRYYYIGIWYKKLYLQTVVWVANRDKPLDGADANLIISQGNLVLLDGLGNSIWSALAASQDTNITVEKASQCRSACFYACSCTAYTYDGSGNCSIWAGDLYNLPTPNRPAFVIRTHASSTSSSSSVVCLLRTDSFQTSVL